ncbi:MAG: NRDE family protein [Acidimicrobiales bacterium]
MCLLMFAWQTEPGYPLAVAANRDERLDRPAHSMCVLRERHPRVLGGRDDMAGGTWLAVNEHGVVSGLTNRPSPGGRDPNKRSRGALPLIAVAQRSAPDAVAELCRRVQPGEYNPAWLLVGDRRSLYYVELAIDRRPVVRELEPGVHVLENAALGDPSPKVDRIRALVEAKALGPVRWAALPSVLADHTVPDPHALKVYERENIERRLASLASCVHTDDYGTRSAALIRVPSEPDAMPDVMVADGPPCTAPFVDVSDYWELGAQPGRPFDAGQGPETPDDLPATRG